MNQKRQPKGIPVGGRYAENHHDEAGVLTAPTDPSDLAAIDARHAPRPRTSEEFAGDGYGEYLAEYRDRLSERYAEDREQTISALEDAVESGLLTKTERTGRVQYETPDIFIGRDADGGRMFVSFRAGVYERGRGTYEDPEVQGNPVRFSMMGAHYEKGRRDADSYGQNEDYLLAVVGGEKDALSREEALELHGLWSKHHLNDMNAGTAVQADIVSKMTAEERGNALVAYDNTKRKLESEGMLTDRGYTYGHDWLMRSVPADDVKRTLALLGKARA